MPDSGLSLPTTRSRLPETGTGSYREVDCTAYIAQHKQDGLAGLGLAMALKPAHNKRGIASPGLVTVLAPVLVQSADHLLPRPF